MSLVCNASFLIIIKSCVREELIYLPFFFRHNLNRSLCKNICLVISYSRPLPLVRAPPQLTLFLSPNTFCLCPFLYSSPSNAAPLTQYTIYNAFNARSKSWIIPAKEEVPIFDCLIRFSNLAIYFGAEKLKRIFISSSSVPSPYSTKQLKTQ